MLVAEEPLAGSGPAGHQAVGQLHHRFVRQGEIEPFLAGHGPFLGLEVAAVELDDPLPGEPAQPRIERQRPVAEEVIQLAAGVGQGLLHDVGRVDQGSQPAVEPHGDHPPQALAVPLQQDIERWPAAAGVLEQFLSLAVFQRLCHDQPANLGPSRTICDGMISYRSFRSGARSLFLGRNDLKTIPLEGGREFAGDL